MKSLKKVFALLAIATIVITLQSCRSGGGCNCPKFSIETSK